MSFETFIYTFILIADHPYISLAFLLICVASLLWVLCKVCIKVIGFILFKIHKNHLTIVKEQDYAIKKVGKYDIRYTTQESNANKYNELKGNYPECG